MEHSTKRNHPLYDLISEYEAMIENGNAPYLEESDFTQLIKFYESERQVDKAFEVAVRAAGQYPFRAAFLLSKASLCLKKDKPYRAMRFLDRAEVVSPNELDIFLLRALCFNALGEVDQALNLLERAKKIVSVDEQIEIFLTESSIYEGIRDFDNMFESLISALEIEPTHTFALERTFVSVELSRKYEESIALHEYILDQEAYSYQAWFNLGHAYACTGEYRMAIEALEYSFLINEDFEQGYLDCAELCSQERDFHTALNIYRELITRFGADCEDLVKMAECQYELRQYEDSRATLIEAMQMDQYNDEVFYFLGRCFMAENRIENAIGAFIKAIELEDRREEYYAELAGAYALMHEYGKADFYYRKSTEIGPEQDCYWINHARFLINIGEFDKALIVVDEADEHTFGPELLYCRAICQLKLNERKKALKTLDEALVEQFSLYTVLFDLVPELKGDEEICSMVRYYQGEKVNFLH